MRAAASFPSCDPEVRTHLSYDVYIKRRTTLEIDEDLLIEAQRVLGTTTMRATIEEALRRAVSTGRADASARAAGQRDYLQALARHADLEVLASEQMWR